MDPLTTLLAAAGHWAEHTSESSSDGVEVRWTSRKFLHAHGESPSATGAATGAANQPATQPDHGPASTGTDCHPAAFPHANHAIGISHDRPSTHRTSHSDVAGHPQHAAAEQSSTRHDANVAADPGRATAGTFAKGPSGVHPSQLPGTHLEAAGRFGTAGDAGSASTAQQHTQHPAARHSDSGEWSSSEHGTGPHTAHQHRLTTFGGSTAGTDVDQSHTQHHKGEDRRAVCPPRNAAGAVHGHSIDATADPEATAKIDDPTATERAEPTGIDQDSSVQIPKFPSRPSQDQAFILRSRSQLGKLPVQDFSSAEAQRSKWSYRAPPTQHTGPREGLSQSSQPQMEARMPSVQYMDLTQETATVQQPPSRFRPSNYTVDLNNTTNPPPPQAMVKPAVMLRRDERPQPVSFTVTEAAQLSRTLSEMGSGSGISEATYSELAAILLSSGRRDQAVDISSEVMSVAEGVHQILFIPWAGRERTTFGMDLGSRHISERLIGHLIRRLSETQRPRSQDRGDREGAGHGGLWERHPGSMVEL